MTQQIIFNAEVLLNGGCNIMMVSHVKPFFFDRDANGETCIHSFLLIQLSEVNPYD